jgi:hypothetical protein
MNHLPSNRFSRGAVTKQVLDILPSIKLAENEPTMKENYFLKTIIHIVQMTPLAGINERKNYIEL